MNGEPDYECPPNPFWVATATYSRECEDSGGTYEGGTYTGRVTVTRQAKSCHSLVDAQNKAMRLAEADSLALCSGLQVLPPADNWS